MNDLISRQAAIDCVDSETVSTNPDHFKSSEKFIKFMEDVDIASFGKWQWANGFNTALVAAKVYLEKLPSADVRENVRGEWVKNEERSAEHVEAIYCCSACCNFEAWGETEKYNFCPNCGADMREVKQ